MRHSRSRALNLSLCGLFSAIICVCSWVTVPTAVPFTLQMLGIYLAVGVLGGKYGLCSVLVYIILGAVGLPVFSGFRGGAGVLLGATGGYIWGFVVDVIFMWLWEKLFGNSVKAFLISQIIATLICYALGSVWFYIVYAQKVGDVGFWGVVSTCVLPFLVPDVAKIVLATILTKKIRKIVNVNV